MWFLLCTLVAVSSFQKLSYQFVPQHTKTPEMAEVEQETIGYVIRFWAGDILVLCALLELSAIWILVSGWRRAA